MRQQLKHGSITIVEILDNIAEKTDPARVVQMKQMLPEREAAMMSKIKMLDIKDNVMEIETKGVNQEPPYDAIVISMGYPPTISSIRRSKSRGRWL